MSESWGARLYGDPCRECGFEWEISADVALAYVEALSAEAARRTDGLSGAARLGFAASARRWIVGLGLADRTLEVPRLGPQPVPRVARVHFVDMLVHRWDLSRGLGRQVPTPDFLVTAALSIARSITVPGSPLVGEGRAYRESTVDIQHTDGLAPIEVLAGLLGRDPEWGRLRG